MVNECRCCDGELFSFPSTLSSSAEASSITQLAACIKWRMGSDVEKIFEKGEEGMQNAEGFIKQMVRIFSLSSVTRSSLNPCSRL